MLTAAKGFNLYLGICLGMAFCSGCRTESGTMKDQLATMRFHLESSRDTTDRTQTVPISRDHPVMLNVQKDPFLTESDISQAQILEVMGGFALRIQFDHHGALLLEQASSAHPGKRFAVFSQFANPPHEKLNKGRWLAAPRINKLIANGALVFTPDATREEADQIVLGLTHVAKKLKKSQY